MQESSFRFQQPVLTSMSFELNPDFEDEEGKKAPISLALAPNIDKKADAREAMVELTVKINYGDGTTKEKDAPFWIVASYASKFIWDNNISDEMAQRMLEVNALSVLLSYIRPMVAQITGASVYPTYHLPFLNLTKMVEDAKKASKGQHDE